MLELAIANNIELFLLLAHTTHKCQPLDVGVFGPGQKAWAQQCDLYYARMGIVMRKEDVVAEYMKAREKAFTKQTILSAWTKCGIRESVDGVSGIDAFKAEDFAPSYNTSIQAHLPDGYPTEPPSDFEPWQHPDDVPTVTEDESSTELTEREFYHRWEEEDGTAGTSHPDNGDSETEKDDDGSEDGREGDSDDGQPAAQVGMTAVEEQEHVQPSNEMNLESTADALVISESDMPLIPRSMTSAHETPCSLSSLSRTTYKMPSNSESASTVSHRSAKSIAQSKRLDELLQTPPKVVTKAALLRRDMGMCQEIALLRAQRNEFKLHVLLTQQELNKAKEQANSKKGKKKGPAVRVDNGELITSREARERRAIRAAELQEKENEKAAKKAKRTEKQQAESTRRAEACRDPTIAFNGSITSKNKGDLQVILATLGLSGDGTNAILKARLQDHFNVHPDDKQHPRYCGLFNTRGRARLPASNVTSGISDNGPPPSTQPASGPSQQP